MACPAVCVCDDTFGAHVFCSRRSLMAVPEGIPTETFRLVLNDNNIAALSVDVFENLTKLEELFLGSNLLQQWPPEVFTGVPLRVLSVNFNRIRRLHSDLLAQLLNLTDLILSNNQIEDLRSGGFQSPTKWRVFSGLRNLRVLHLYSNDIRIISAGAFSDLSSLTDLRLDQNKITRLPEAVFANASFVSLLLGRNYLTALPAEVFSGCARLETLGLEHNNLTTLPPDVYTGLSELSTANLGFNPWMCDCRLQGLVRWINSSSLTDGDLGNPSCSSPPQTLGVSLRETWPDRVCPHGSCSEEHGGKVTCECDLGWSGLYCQNDQNTTPFEEESSSTIQEQGNTPMASPGQGDPFLAVSIATSVGIIVVMIVALVGFLLLLRRRMRRRQEDIVMIDSFSPFDKDDVSLQDHIARSRYVHGDLAARNVLVGEDLKVKISDFGLAEDIYSRGYRRQDRLRKIPWKWMAPERLQDGAVYTAQSDVWSFGIVLYEISTLGGVPYPDVPSDGLKDQLQAGYRMSKPEGCPHAIYDLMQQCWRWRPSDRPTFRQLELTLDKHLSFHGPEYTQLTPRPSENGT
ncbi:uncharacterized protein [Branchiostoma lanceolatum]|uniref:uncharacterized protein n=1 Tax=Branchiostoma lanceolatum TaxID=7740 RepID=UPI0034572842